MSDDHTSASPFQSNPLFPYAETLRRSFNVNPRNTYRLTESFAGSTSSDTPAAVIDTGSESPHPPDACILLHARPEVKASGYHLSYLENIGTGGMAKVDAARQHSLERDIAIKRPRRDRHTVATTKTIIKEARLMARLAHPNIPPVYELAYSDDGLPIILMKRVRGTPWSVLLHQDDHPYWDHWRGNRLKRHLQVFCQVCNALEYAHSEGVLHRDIKMENVMVGEFGEVYLLDWGLAVELDDAGFYKADHFCGTPCFAAPEMSNGSSPLSTYTDIYLLGGVLHELLTGEVLHSGETLEAVMEQIRLSPARQYPPHVHPNLAALANTATARRPEDRIASVKDLREAIERHIEQFQAQDLLASTKQKLTELQRTAVVHTRDDFQFHQLAFECRFGFHRVKELSSELAGATEGLVSVLILQAEHELRHGRVDAPQHLLTQIEELAPEHPHLADLQARVRTILQQREASSELTTQIQYKLLEELQKRSRE